MNQNFLHTACILSGEGCNRVFSDYHAQIGFYSQPNERIIIKEREKILFYILEHKKLNTYTKNQLFISINIREKPYRKMTIKMAIARLIFAP